MGKKKKVSQEERMREEPSQDDSSTSPTSPMTSSLSATVPDPLMRLERARVIDTYTAALKDADTKALTLFENVSVQVQRSLNSSARLYSAILIVVTIILAISVYIALFVDAKAHPLTPYYSVIALLAGLIVLIVLIFRNPLRNTHYLVENLVRLNVVFLGFVRRIHQNDLALKYTFLQDEKPDPKLIFAAVETLQTIVDQATEEIQLILRDMGE